MPVHVRPAQLQAVDGWPGGRGDGESRGIDGRGVQKNGGSSWKSKEGEEVHRGWECIVQVERKRY